VDSGEGAGARPLLGDTGSPGWRWDNDTPAKEDDMSIGKLFLELTGEAQLNLLELREEWHGNQDNDSLLASSDLDLSCAVELQRPKRSFQVSDLCLKIEQRLGDAVLQFTGISLGRGIVGNLDCSHSGEWPKSGSAAMVFTGIKL